MSYLYRDDVDGNSYLRNKQSSVSAVCLLASPFVVKEELILEFSRNGVLILFPCPALKHSGGWVSAD